MNTTPTPFQAPTQFELERDYELEKTAKLLLPRVKAECKKRGATMPDDVSNALWSLFPDGSEHEVVLIDLENAIMREWEAENAAHPRPWYKSRRN